MKSSSTFQILNKEPKLYLEYELLQQIKYIVKIAPKEAQWFHRLTIDADGDFVLNNMFIPEQICSNVEVDTDSSMMIKFYRELVEKHGAEETNNILSELNCWCHSHHNMGTNPSGQDVKQFGELIKASIDQKTNNPVVMLIFNKKDEYYCRAYDPVSGNIYEGLEISIYSKEYKWIDEEAKLKFKEPAYKPVSVTSAVSRPTLPKMSTYWGSSSTSSNDWSSNYWDNNYSHHTYSSSSSSKLTAASKAAELIEECYGKMYSNLTIVEKNSIQDLVQILSEEFDSVERFIMLSLLKKADPLSLFDKTRIAKDKSSPVKTWISSIMNCLNKSKITIAYLENLVTVTFEMADQFELNLKEDFIMWAEDFYSTEKDFSAEPKTVIYNPLKDF